MVVSGDINSGALTVEKDKCMMTLQTDQMENSFKFILKQASTDAKKIN